MLSETLSPASDGSDRDTPKAATTRFPHTSTTHRRDNSFGGGHVTRNGNGSTSESDWSLPDQPRGPSRQASQSTLTPPVRVFPRPPMDGNYTPTIRPGSVRSVTLERGPDDDAASRGSIRSFRATVSKPRPALPYMASNDSLLPTMVQAIESSIGSNAITGAAGSSTTSLGGSGSAGGQGKRSAPSSSTTKQTRVNRDLRPDRATKNHKSRTGETADRVTALNGQSNGHDGVGVIGSFDKRLNRSVMSLGVKAKAEKVVNADPQPRLASLYLVTGLFKVSAYKVMAQGD